MLGDAASAGNVATVIDIAARIRGRDISEVVVALVTDLFGAASGNCDGVSSRAAVLAIAPIAKSSAWRRLVPGDIRRQPVPLRCPKLVLGRRGLVTKETWAACNEYASALRDRGRIGDNQSDRAVV